MKKGKVEEWNPEIEYPDSFYFKKEKNSFSLKRSEGRCFAILAGNLSLFTAFFCCVAAKPMLTAMPLSDSLVILSGAALGLTVAYELRKNALNLLGKSGLLEIYSDMIKDLHQDIRERIDEHKQEKNLEKENTVTTLNKQQEIEKGL